MPIPFMAVAPIQLALKMAHELRCNKIVSIIDPEQESPNFDGDHLVLRFHDIAHGYSVGSRFQPPFGGHIHRLIEFAREFTPHDRVMVHCHMGVSRSPAAVLIIAAALTGSADVALATLQAVIPSGLFEPNTRMVSLADRQLRMGGALEQAIERPMAPAPDPTSIW